ncbi:cupin domain-containing protein [Bacillus sp. DTU_2020_1000418_1_SI_GHA_SEK_038]|uniref:cupin domain-containing protein n=1 Tax=Bacillus sp. DTU_2020_1000418_1_SI_GHA_SEK_038 TaxID=3077585 RepID=UPI0028E6A4B8|nr:cupin domain-containing protein [Bacillus sp. DTU_2020_1000418_1_SI_GHA_SEK_038]WNS76539.1 cupin domain-containing protein [Bacillus sp. DTU_2020_1000418_1_SI_GHA_SEK_038]
MNNHDAQYFVSKLGLEPHPEGGYYKRTFESGERTSDQELTVNFEGKRKLYTSIYFLLTSNDLSHLHRLKSDELWYYHAGSPLTIHIIHENGEYEEIKLGLNLDKGEVPQALVPKNAIFGSSVMEEDTFSLVGCMVSPGFEFQDFELFTQDELLSQYPTHKEIIEKLAYKTIPE